MATSYFSHLNYLSFIQLLMSGKKILKFEKEQIIQDKRINEVFNFSTFKKNLSIEVIHNTPQTIELQINGIQPSLANALRRIAIAEIPTMAFHKVFLYQNTSVLPDELLVHRLGLLPLKVDPISFQFKKQDEDLCAKNSLKFELKVICKRKNQYMKLSEQQIDQKGLKPEHYLQNCNIYSNQLKWIPQGDQDSKYKQIKLVHENILIAKLGENQQINIDIYAEKGIGKKHAKWSPVSTAFYRLMPHITLNGEFSQQKHADVLVSCCPSQVFEKKNNKAMVARARDCTTCRECINLQGVELGKIQNHFIFTIESLGIFTPEQIFLRSLQILEDKAKIYVI